MIDGFELFCFISANISALQGALRKDRNAANCWRLDFILCIEYDGVELSAKIEWVERVFQYLLIQPTPSDTHHLVRREYLDQGPRKYSATEERLKKLFPNVAVGLLLCVYSPSQFEKGFTTSDWRHYSRGILHEENPIPGVPAPSVLTLKGKSITAPVVFSFDDEGYPIFSVNMFTGRYDILEQRRLVKEYITLMWRMAYSCHL